MNSRRAALFDGIEESGIRASSLYSSHEIDGQENDRAVDGLQDRVNLLKRVIYTRRLRLVTEYWTEWAMTWIVQEEFYPEPWINLRWMFSLVASFVVIFLVVNYLIRDVSECNMHLNVCDGQKDILIYLLENV
ncbi:bet1-like SNARE 1-1 isoform X1 [Olea europaea subsp. europaea]|uniref:Bet1-like SNARE 1-1 isoform X1 n=1 Tax=Olea europaea subsp. europaea TaxID=158383 RepID=A0A8S0Q2L8_OLEEU|nr:bet1-like SNARE 1-1 isoform X1 [Olea europaea subsp. europaea]